MEHLVWIVMVALGTGWIAKMILPGRDPNGMVITILLGLGGSAIRAPHVPLRSGRMERPDDAGCGTSRSRSDLPRNGTRLRTDVPDWLRMVALDRQPLRLRLSSQIRLQ